MRLQTAGISRDNLLSSRHIVNAPMPVSYHYKDNMNTSPGMVEHKNNCKLRRLCLHFWYLAYYLNGTTGTIILILNTSLVALSLSLLMELGEARKSKIITGSLLLLLSHPCSNIYLINGRNISGPLNHLLYLWYLSKIYYDMLVLNRDGV